MFVSTEVAQRPFMAFDSDSLYVVGLEHISSVTFTSLLYGLDDVKLSV